MQEKVKNEDLLQLGDFQDDYANSRAENEYDTEAKESLVQTPSGERTDKGKPRRIIDADGDGVEDNVKKSQWELDAFRKPVYGVAVWDMHNTHNGELPGHVKFGEGHEPGTNPWAKADA